MKKLISILTAVTTVILCGCSSDGGNTKQAADVDKVPVSQIWNGYETLQGQDFDIIKMPDKINPLPTDGLALLELSPVAPEDEKESCRQFFKAFFGDKYDESNIEIMPENLEYFYNDPEVGYAVFTHGDGVRYALPISAVVTGENASAVIDKILGEFDPIMDKDSAIELPDGIFTIGELCESAEKFVKDGLYPLYGSKNLIISPYRLIYGNSAEDPDNRVAEVIFAYSYKGVRLHENGSVYHEDRFLNGYNTQTYYVSFSLDVDLKGTGHYTGYLNNTLSYEVLPEEIKNAVPLTGAVELLKNELAPNSRYEFSNVTLKYCHKQTAVDGGDLTDEERLKASEALKEYNTKITPTWCFEWTGYDANGAHNCAIRVNAVTGEITVDAIPNERKAPTDSNANVTVTTAPKPEPVKPKKLTVDVESYDGKTLTYTYEGKTESSDVPPDTFEVYIKGLRHMSTQIINNKYGIRVKCILEFDGEGNLVKADVKTPNGEYIQGNFGVQPTRKWEQEHPNEVYGEAKARRIEGSVYEVSNEFGTAQIDLNDLSYKNKADYPDEIDRVLFTAYRFTGGETVLDTFSFLDKSSFDGESVESRSKTIQSLPMFAGRVQSVSEGRAVVILTDGVTVCDVPTYYNDGKIETGMDVMLTLDKGVEFCGSGEHYKADYAVFTTHPEVFIEGYESLEHNKIAYALADEHSSVQYNAVMRDKI